MQYDYQSFLQQKAQQNRGSGFDPIVLPDVLMDFQRTLSEWAIRQGRGAIFADTGLGESYNTSRQGEHEYVENFHTRLPLPDSERRTSLGRLRAV